MSASHPFCEPRRPEFNLDPGVEGLMHSHYTLTNQRAKDSVLALAQPIFHGTRIQTSRNINKQVLSYGVRCWRSIVCGLLSEHSDRRHRFDLVWL